MSAEIMNAEFTNNLHRFLMEEGYTYILSLGAVNNTIEDNRDDYRLQALKSDDPRLSFEEADYIIERIESSDVLDMVHGDPFIRFLVELPIVDYEKYLHDKTNQ